MEVNWNLVETITKAIVVIGGAGVSLFQLYNRLPRSRAPLIRDLEILKMLDPSDPAYKVIRDSVDGRIAKIYNPSPTSIRRIRVYSWPQLVFGIVMFGIFGVWTYSLFRDHSWWAVLTGFVTLGGIGNAMSAFDEKARRVKAQPHETTNAGDGT